MTAGGSGRSDAQDRGQREHLLAAGGESTRALLAGQQTHDVLHVIAAKARQGTPAALALSARPDVNLLVVDAAVGSDSHGEPIRLTAVPYEGLRRDSSGTLRPADFADPPNLGLRPPAGRTETGVTRRGT